MDQNKIHQTTFCVDSQYQISSESIELHSEFMQEKDRPTIMGLFYTRCEKTI
jgi:hypothetical protein